MKGGLAADAHAVNETWTLAEVARACRYLDSLADAIKRNTKE